ncbi:LOW QUALITY PROTEIN: WD repeat-containing protein 55 homolog [Macrobrachium nipponense]|uniref:LOW QUALITY PROTEIN: WD repeat-containing protein 55 homolog n=1 Tax=Macrobrachium nipponense TaxID=159736 RepID=UPI0030C83B8D
MISFQEDPPESDDSDEEIPPGGVLFPIVAIQDIESGEEENGAEDGNSSIGDNGPDIEDALSEADISVNDDSDTDSDSSSVPETTIEEVFGIKPSLELLSAATWMEEIIIYRYSRDTAEEVTRLSHHGQTCRTVCYSADGKVLYSVSKDQSFAIVDIQNSSIKSHFKEAHEASIYSFVEIDENICATGDDDGVVKLWDLRKNKSIFSYKCGEQTVHSLFGDKKYVAATLCDGSLSGINIRAKRLEAQSEMYESELTAMALVRDDSRLVVGSGEGVLFIFKWGDFGFHIDRYAGHPGQINCIIPISDRLLLTGCEDGNIRAVHLYAHRFVGVVGQHKRFGVENMSISHDGSFLASCAMDDVIRFWNIDFLYDVQVDGTLKGHKKHDTKG